MGAGAARRDAAGPRGAPVLLSSRAACGGSRVLDAAIEAAVEQVSREIKNLRSLITDLRPASLDEIGLGAALEGLLDHVAPGRPRDRRAVDLAWEHGDAVTRLIPELETAIYRVVQEAPTNVVEHATPSTRVTVLEQGDCVLVTVVDDGVGFDRRRPTQGSVSRACASE